VASRHCFCVGLCVFEDGDASLINGIEVDEEHVQTTCPTIGLLGGALDVYVWCGVMEEWWFGIKSHIPLAECVVDHASCLGCSKV